MRTLRVFAAALAMSFALDAGAAEAQSGPLSVSAEALLRWFKGAAPPRCRS
jgi:hypothetical protein